MLCNGVDGSNGFVAVKLAGVGVRLVDAEVVETGVGKAGGGEALNDGFPNRVAIEIPAVGLAAGIGELPIELTGDDGGVEVRGALFKVTPSPDRDNVAPVKDVGRPTRCDI